MGFIALKCPSCGADITLDGDREFGFCQFCGTKIIQDKTVVEHRGSVSLDRSGEENNYIARAQEMIEKGDYDEAEFYFNRVLDINTNNSIARRGLNNIYKIIKEPNLFLKYYECNNQSSISVVIDGVNSGTIQAKSSKSFLLSVGKHEIVLTIAKSLCPYFKFTIEIKDRYSKFDYNISSKFNGVLTISPKVDLTMQKKKMPKILLIPLIVICTLFFLLAIIIIIGVSSDKTDANNTKTTSVSEQAELVNYLPVSNNYKVL